MLQGSFKWLCFVAMRFLFEAVDSSGKILKGEILATDEAAALSQLREKELVPLKLVKAEKAKGWRLRRTDTLHDLALFSEQLLRLLKAGLPLDKALETMKKVFDSGGRKSLAIFAQELLSEIKEGKSLSEALKGQPKVPPFYLHLIQAGEASGALIEMLEALSKYLKERQQFQRELVSALIYPIFLIVFGIFAVQTVLVYILPKFARIFEEIGTTPPLLTRILLKIGLFWRHWGPFVLIGMGLGFFWLRAKWKEPQTQKQLERWVSKIPFLGPVLLEADLARTFRGLAVMIKGGVPIEKALSTASAMPKTHFWRNILEEAAQAVKEGRSFSSVLSHLPPQLNFVLDLLVVGEETGQLGQTIEDIARLCEEEVRLHTKRFLTLLEPLSILIIGLILGLIIVSILLAIFSLNI